MAARVADLRGKLYQIVEDFEKENPKAYVTAVYVEHKMVLDGDRTLTNVSVRVEF